MLEPPVGLNKLGKTISYFRLDEVFCTVCNLLRLGNTESLLVKLHT